jgi:hypothetical protein
MKISISVLPIAIRIAKYRKKSIEKTIDKWRANLETAKAPGSIELLQEGITHFIIASIQNDLSIAEMIEKHKANKLITW